MKKTDRFKRILLLLVGLLIFGGCGNPEFAVKEDAFYLYYLDNEGVSLKMKAANLKSEDTDGQIEEVISRLSDAEEAGDYGVAIPSTVKLSSYDLEDGILSLHFSGEYGELPPASEIMLRAAVVKTLMQIPGINAVMFYVVDKPLQDAAGKEIGAQNDESFLTSFGEETGEIESRLFVLYYVSEKGDSLVRTETTVHYNSNASLEGIVLEYLAKTPNVKGARAAIADGVHVLDVSTSDGICYVDLDGNFLSQTTGISTQAAVYAIVDSLCQLPGIEQVQLLIDAETDSVVETKTTVSGLYEPDYRLVK